MRKELPPRVVVVVYVYLFIYLFDVCIPHWFRWRGGGTELTVYNGDMRDVACVITWERPLEGPVFLSRAEYFAESLFMCFWNYLKTVFKIGGLF